jgi:hypothetical protein
MCEKGEKVGKSREREIDGENNRPVYALASSVAIGKLKRQVLIPGIVAGRSE